MAHKLSSKRLQQLGRNKNWGSLLAGKAAIAESSGARKPSHFSKIEGVDGRILKISNHRLFYAIDRKQRMHLFTLDKFQNYGGETLEEIGVHEGTGVRLQIKDGDVLNVRITS